MGTASNYCNLIQKEKKKKEKKKEKRGEKWNEEKKGGGKTVKVILQR